MLILSITEELFAVFIHPSIHISMSDIYLTTSVYSQIYVYLLQIKLIDAKMKKTKCSVLSERTSR